MLPCRKQGISLPVAITLLHHHTPPATALGPSASLQSPFPILLPVCLSLVRFPTALVPASALILSTRLLPTRLPFTNTLILQRGKSCVAALTAHAAYPTTQVTWPESR